MAILKIMSFLFFATVMSNPSDLMPPVMKLSFRWPPGYCLGQKCKQIPERFVLGGLVQEPPGKKGSTDQVSEHIFARFGNDLELYWPDLFTEESSFLDKDYYRKEYERNGAYCTEMNVEDYFFEITYFANECLTELLEHMEAGRFNIKPGEVPYHPVFIVDSLMYYTWGLPELVCKKHGDRYYLAEVIVCFDATMRHLLSCSSHGDQELSHTCKEDGHIIQELYFPKAN